MISYVSEKPNAKNLESHCPGHSLRASSAKISIYRLASSNQIALTAGQDSPACAKKGCKPTEPHGLVKTL